MFRTRTFSKRLRLDANQSLRQRRQQGIPLSLLSIRSNPQSLGTSHQSSTFHSSTFIKNNRKDPISFSDAHFGPNSNPKGKDSTSSSSPSSSEGEGPIPSSTEHAVISTFDLFSIGIGPSSSHTVGPLRIGSIFVEDLKNAGLLGKCHSLKCSLYGSLAATGEGHLTPSALLLGLEGADCETVDTDSVGPRFEEIKQKKSLRLGRDTKGANGGVEVNFDYQKDLSVSMKRDLECKFFTEKTGRNFHLADFVLLTSSHHPCDLRFPLLSLTFRLKSSSVFQFQLLYSLAMTSVDVGSDSPSSFERIETLCL